MLSPPFFVDHLSIHNFVYEVVPGRWLWCAGSNFLYVIKGALRAPGARRSPLDAAGAPPSGHPSVVGVGDGASESDQK
jgi:hypothetical protein